MDKLKNIVSGGHHKEEENQVDRPTTAGGTPIAAVHNEGEHPIYDQMRSPVANSFGGLTSTKDHAPGSAIGTSSLQPNPNSLQRPPPGNTEWSNASIKSGVIGFPPSSSDSRPANPLSDTTAKTGEHQPFEKSLGQSIPSSGTERSFPLTGGVTSHKSTEKATPSGNNDGHGRENLAGAAAAAVASSAVPGHRHEAASTTQSTLPNESNQSHHPDALAAATTAATNTPSVPPIGQNTGATSLSSPTNTAAPSNQSQGGVKGLLYTKGPHSTDIANKADPKLHIPGAFPSPTPITETAEPSYNFGNSIDATAGGPGGQHELRHTGTLDDPLTRSADPADKDDHHHGRDAAIAGGLGAAGAGAYAAGKHHEEPHQSGSEIFPEEKNPYSSTKIDPRVDSTPKFSEQRYDASSTDKPQAQDPLLTNTTSSQPQSDKSHHGRDAALVGAGAGAVTTGALYASQRAHEPETGPASSTIGPHESNVANVMDPRVQPDPSLQKHHQAASTIDDPASSTVGPHKSNVANVMDPRVLPDPQKQKAAPKEEKEHHYGRDAAIVGGTGAAGYGAYEAAKTYGDHKSTGPAASMNDQRYDPTIPQGTKAPFSSVAAQGGQGPQHHYGRDAAVLGGVGAAGAGAYGATRAHDDSQPKQGSLGQQQYPASTTVDHQYSPTTTTTTTTSTNQQQHHYGRDAAVVGGLGAAGAGAYAATRGNDHYPSQPSHQTHTIPQSQQHSPLSPVHYTSAATETNTGAAHQRYDSTQLNPNSPKSPQHTKRDAAAVGATGAALGAGGAYAYSQHDHEAAQKAHEQRLKDEEKLFQARQKEQEKALHDREKQQDDLEKKHERQSSKDHDKQEKEKHHGLFGFLHRDKDKKRNSSGSAETSPRASADNSHHSRDYAAAGAGVGAAGLGAAAMHESGRSSGRTSSEKEREGRNKLHKDPPKGHPAREAMEHAQHPQDYNMAGGASGTGTGMPTQTHSNAYGTHSPDRAHHTVIEPHTGLPMNVEKYGDGRGGTDGNPAIEGYHAHSHDSAVHGAGAGLGPEASVTDWSAIKKANTPY